MIITVNYVVRNGGQYVRFFLDSLKKQTFKDFEVHVWDNNSDDDTREIIKNEYPEFKLHESKENIGVWAAFEKLVHLEAKLPSEDVLGSLASKYVICMTDVILKEDFIEKAIAVMEKEPQAGALQAKIYQMELYNHGTWNMEHGTKIIDTLGFKIFRSRKIINLGQGEEDKGQYNNLKEVFAVEGAVPIFRREALESCRINGWLIDPDYRSGPLGYGDDLDLAWRMRLFGWKHVLSHEVVAYHDRSTTKDTSSGAISYLKRVKERRKIDIQKRRLDWRNTRFTIIKNDYIINILRDLPRIISREIAVFGYTLMFEPQVLREIGNFIKYLPRMIKRRGQIMKKAKASPKEMRQWITSK